MMSFLCTCISNAVLSFSGDSVAFAFYVFLLRKLIVSVLPLVVLEILKDRIAFPGTKQLGHLSRM